MEMGNSMIPVLWLVIASGFVAIIALGMAALLIARRQRGTAHRSLATLLAATAIANLADGAGLLDEAHGMFWREVAIAAELVQPAAILYIGLAFLSPAESGNNLSALWRARALGIIGAVLAMVAVAGLVFQRTAVDDGRTVMALVLGD
jgi:hypothetical protein